MRRISYKLEYSNIERKHSHSSSIVIAARFLEEEHKVTRQLGEFIYSEVLVRSRRLELPRDCSHSDLNAARLPVPPRPHMS